ncbi:thioredoxin reductase [Paenibacillus baekrokdamisoli]|uniref:Thioredoxin reductase n=1 Tax=Paenibacillus baekrokdamisoli TaxID=1712516 RepID=A0A3G9IW58_9BACL|nr:FAD-dependent oxidoreductase [Paenibacillus baekrokdamisoli]MBB3072083.1 thioredoxin reductase (NADPH) [Paenibacillus baekrokdamisoli]BBH20385.1 thioredoxin reductase [Paenibacillus baekrokdamisoli]
MEYKSIVIGAGFAGFTAAIYLARAGLKPLVIKGLKPSHHLTTTEDIEYFPGFTYGTNGPALLDNMFRQAEQYGAVVRMGEVMKLDLSKRPFSLLLEGQGELVTETLVIASGATPKLLDIPGEKDQLGLGVNTCATCSGFFTTNKKVIIVGGGDSAMEEALYLAHYASEIVMVNRSDHNRASISLQEKVRGMEKVKWLMNRTPVEAMTGEKGVTGLKVIHNDTQEEEIILGDYIFVAIGNKPNTEFLKGQLPLDDQGYVIVKPGTTETEIPGVFACGDVQDRRYRQIVNAISSGCMSAIDCQRFLAPTH